MRKKPPRPPSEKNRPSRPRLDGEDRREDRRPATLPTRQPVRRPERANAPGVVYPGAAREVRLLYGAHAVAAAWINPERICRRLLVTEGGLKSIEAVLRNAGTLGLDRPRPVMAERPELDRITAGGVHQGVVLEVEPLEEPALDDVIAACDGRPATLIALDQVTDPHNIGAVLRSASAFGAAAVITTRHNAPDITALLAKTASGAVETTAYVRVPNLVRALETLMDAGFVSIALDESGEKHLAALGPFSRTVLVMGAEGEGLRRLTREAVQFTARLPTGGPVGSLNVSNAAAVALYELARGV